MLLDSRGQPKDPNAMDISCAGEEDWASETEFGDFDVGSVGRVDHCNRCGGTGYIANECPISEGTGNGNRGFSAK